MFALFGKDCDLVGQIQTGKHIFDINMSWVAYISNNHAWSAEAGNCLGPAKGIICLDQSDKVVAQNPIESVSGTSKPAKPASATSAAKPARPARPAHPAMPATPVDGWSNESFLAWLSK